MKLSFDHNPFVEVPLEPVKPAIPVGQSASPRYMLYHPTIGATVVETAEQLAKLSDEWTDEPHTDTDAKAPDVVRFDLLPEAAFKSKKTKKADGDQTPVA
jgi:hypothetical protein